MKIRNEVKDFAKAMESKLKKNDHKVHWSNCNNLYLLSRLREELEELLEAYEKNDAHGIMDETVDVANISMMIHDNTKRSLEEE